MYTFSGTPTTIVTITHRASDYSEEDIKLLHSELAFLGNIRSKGYLIPAAGAGTDLILVIEFIGTAAASGIIGTVAYNLFSKLATSLLRLFNHRKEQFPLLQFDKIKVVYEDIEIQIALTSPKVIKNLPEIMMEIHRLISTSNQSIHEIYMPVGYNVDEFTLWHGNLPNYSPDYPFRYWLLRVKDASGSERIYDTHTGQTIETWSITQKLSEHLKVIKTEMDTDELLETLLTGQGEAKNTSQE
jgi:hypothetical protein